MAKPVRKKAKHTSHHKPPKARQSLPLSNLHTSRLTQIAAEQSRQVGRQVAMLETGVKECLKIVDRHIAEYRTSGPERIDDILTDIRDHLATHITILLNLSRSPLE